MDLKKLNLSVLSILILSSAALAETRPNQIYFQMGSPDIEHYKENDEKYESKTPASIVIHSAAVDSDNSENKKFEVKFHTRGQTSISAPRRNFQIESVNTEEMSVGKIKGKKIILTSMWQDEGYISNKIGFKIMHAVGLEKHKTEYAELILNGKSQGLYLVSNKVEDEATKELDSPLVIRRRYLGGFETAKYVSKHSKLSEKEMLDQYQALKNLTSSSTGNELSGEALFGVLKAKMNLGNYFSWMGSNYLLQNGDYSDEVFFYVTKESPTYSDVYFDVLPWDFDDLFKSKMHFHPANFIPSLLKQNKSTLIYNFEDQLDFKIATDSFLLGSYHSHIKNMLMSTLTDQKIKEIISEVREEILPYLDNQAIFENSKLDSVNKGQAYSKEFILALLDKRENDLLLRRAEMLEVLNKKK